MSENPVPISNLNDFIFCPASIYFHLLDYDTEKLTYQDSDQINGTAAHKTVDSCTYSDKKSILQSVSVYSDEYNLYGKIDIYDTKKLILTERKKKIKQIYDGYVFQLYAQYFGLKEAGFVVKQIRLYSMDDNKIYNIELPEENIAMFQKFKRLINSIRDFKFDGFKQKNKEKCIKCVYEELCSFSALKE